MKRRVFSNKGQVLLSSFTTITTNIKNPWMTWTIKFFLKYNKAPEITAHPALYLRVTTLHNTLEATRQSNQQKRLNGERLEQAPSLELSAEPHTIAVCSRRGRCLSRNKD